MNAHPIHHNSQQPLPLQHARQQQLAISQSANAAVHASLPADTTHPLLGQWPTSQPQGQAESAPEIALSQVGDSAEQEADAVANRILRRPAQAATATDMAAPKEVSPALAAQLQGSRHGGSSLPAALQQQMGAAMGADFSSVRIHHDHNAAQMNDALHSSAFTFGQDIYFDQGAYRPESDAGQHLLAHELTHVVQQGAAAPRGQQTISRHSRPTIARHLRVVMPNQDILRPHHQGIVQSNATTAEQYLHRLCPEGAWQVAPRTGHVQSSVPNFCPGVHPQTHLPTPGGNMGTHPLACGRICELIQSRHHWAIVIDDRRAPSTFLHNAPDSERPGVGTGGEVHVPSPNSPNAYGSVTDANTLGIDPEHMLLAHELLGHGFLANRGELEPDHYDLRGRGGHQRTVEEQNRLGREQPGIPMRGLHRAAYCGESFSVPRAQLPSLTTPSGPRFGTGLNDCIAWRNEYNTLNHTAFTIDQAIPPRPGEILPPDTVVNGIVHP